MYELRQICIVYLNIIFFLLHWSNEIYNLGSINVIVWINISPSETHSYNNYQRGDGLVFVLLKEIKDEISIIAVSLWKPRLTTILKALET